MAVLSLLPYLNHFFLNKLTDVHIIFIWLSVNLFMKSEVIRHFILFTGGIVKDKSFAIYAERNQYHNEFKK